MKRTPVLLGIVVAFAFAFAFGARAHDDGHVRLAGKVKSAAADGASFELAASGATIKVDLAAVEVALAKARPIKDCGSETIYVLGHKHDASRRQKAFIQAATAIVAGGPFAPGPIPHDLAGQKLEWTSGALTFEKGMPHVGGYEVHVAPDRLVLVLGKAPKNALASGRLVFVEGAETGEKKDRAIAAKRVIVLAPEIPQAEYHAALGL